MFGGNNHLVLAQEDSKYLLEHDVLGRGILKH